MLIPSVSTVLPAMRITGALGSAKYLYENGIQIDIIFLILFHN